MLSNSIADFVSSNKSGTELDESSIVDGGASMAHKVQIEMKVVNAKQSKPEDFLGFDQVTNVGA